MRKSPFRSVLAIWFFACLVAVSSRAQSNPAPILNIGWRSNQLQVSILNAATGRVYQIQQRSSVDYSTSWTPQLLSAPGQTNFTISPQSNFPQFFRAWLVPDAPPQILSFTASPAALLTNGNVTLHWSVAAAASLSLNKYGQQYIARGNGSTKVFTLPNPNIVASSLKVFKAPISVIPVTRAQSIRSSCQPASITWRTRKALPFSFRETALGCCPSI